MKHLISEADEARIREAVRQAEQRTAGEIVPVVVPQSARYDVAVWRAASITAVAALALTLAVYLLYDGWGLRWLHEGWGVVLVTLVAGSTGALLAAYVPPVKRLFAGSAYMARRVHQRAMQAFVEEEVFGTRDRTGILLFISLLEHRIEVLGDTGISAVVDPDEWGEIVVLVRDGIRSGRPAEGIVQAVERCGVLLEKRGVALKPDDVNELPDGLRIRDSRR